MSAGVAPSAPSERPLRLRGDPLPGARLDAEVDGGTGKVARVRLQPRLRNSALTRGEGNLAD